MKKTTKECVECGATNLVCLASMNLKICGQCGQKMNWYLDDGQIPLLANNRQKQTKGKINGTD